MTAPTATPDPAPEWTPEQGIQAIANANLLMGKLYGQRQRIKVLLDALDTAYGQQRRIVDDTTVRLSLYAEPASPSALAEGAGIGAEVERVATETAAVLHAAGWPEEAVARVFAAMGDEA